MKIKRVIHGEEVEIELTKEEIAEACNEQEHLIDCEMVRENLTCGWYNEFDDLSDEEFETAIDEIAYEKRRQQNKYELDDVDAVDVARKQYVETHFRQAGKEQEHGEEVV